MLKNDTSKNGRSHIGLYGSAPPPRFLQTLTPMYKVESSYCHYLEMLKIRKSKRNDLISFLRVVTYESLPASLQSFKTFENHFEKSPGEVMAYDGHSSFGAVKKCW